MDKEQRTTQLITQEYEQCGRIWKRVAPELDPYPDHGGGREMATRENLLALPGAEADPCCMGTQAQLSIDVLKSFLHGELSDCCIYATLARRVSVSSARRVFRQFAAEEEMHARRLSAAIFLITGERYCPRVYHDAVPVENYCVMLRRRYHEEACGGFNYARAAEETNDICLRELLEALSADEYRHAKCILDLLSRAMD